MRRKPGTDTKFPAQFAGNWLSVPGFAPRETLRLAVSPKPLSTPVTVLLLGAKFGIIISSNNEDSDFHR
jgi:hypothetical protein